MSDKSRRQFLRLASGVAVIPLLNVQSVQAAELVPLEETDPQAVALKYKKSASEAESLPNFKKGSRCDNCMHYVADTKGCRIFPGKSVEPGGWCAVWAPV